MSFQKRRVTQSKREYNKKVYNTQKSKKPSRGIGFIVKVFLWGFFAISLLFLGGSYILYAKYIQDLPPVDELENQEIAEASVIYDRDGNELYKVFEEKRTYKNFSDISENMINAIVAGEDKRYWENPGIDFIGLTRAVLYRASGKSEQLEGTSTLTQQLVRNMVITNERTYERKVKEMYLAYKLTNDLSKEKILELYLNKIEFGSNAFGIEQAAQTFFGKKASELGILESSLLASLPKGPTYYSPYSNYDRLVGYTYTYDEEDTESTTSLITTTDIEANQSKVDAIKEFIAGWKLRRYSETKALICGLEEEKVKSFISVDNDGCSIIDYSDLLVLLNGIKIEVPTTVTDEEGNESEEINIIEYQTGRKDFILGRMLEDSYISFEEYRDALLTSIGFQFEPYSEDIKYPHFVFYVREYLEEKYGREIIERGGLKIYTSIDPVLQDEAERIVKERAAANETKFGATNASLISIDNQTGQILAMVGGRDYFDEENKGNINMTTAELQPGSTFKSFVYSMAIDQEIIGTKTPIYDVKTTFPGGYTPNNFDGGFRGKMTVAAALNESRNIPAVKMFFLAGGEEKIINWMEKLGVKTIREFKDEYNANNDDVYTYGSSMALGTAMMTPLELARAYSVYANMGVLKDVAPIIKIYDSDGLVIEEFEENSNPGEEVIDPATAFITNSILSDTGERPSFWNNYLSISGRKAAAKTGTSTKQYEQNGRKIIYPRNLWTAGYTPQVTTVVWAGNNNGAETNFNGNGLEAAGPIWKEFMEFYHSDEPALDWSRPSGVKEVSISNLSGLLAPEGMSSDLIVRSLFVNAPSEYDSPNNTVEVDLLCNGMVTETTPDSAIGRVRIIRLRSLMPDNQAWEAPVQAWLRSSGYGGNNGGSISSVPTEVCERRGITGNIQVGANIQNGDEFVVGGNFIELGYESTYPLRSIELLLDGESIATTSINDTSGIKAINFNIPRGRRGNATLTVRAIDDEFFRTDRNYSIKIITEDNAAPVIEITNPIDGSIALNSGDTFNLRGNVSDTSAIRTINIYRDDVSIANGIEGRNFVYNVSTSGLSAGTYTINVEAIDMSFNKGYASVQIRVLGNPSTPTEEDTNNSETDDNTGSSDENEDSLIEGIFEEDLF